MTQTLIEKLEAAKQPVYPNMRPVDVTYNGAINDAIAIVRQHEAAPLTDAERAEAVEVMARGLDGHMSISYGSQELAEKALAALLERYELRRKA